MVISLYLTLIRLLTPFLILRWPLWGILLCTVIDMYDWKFVNIDSEADFMFYQTWDKIMDLYYQFFILIIVFRFKDIWVKNIAIFLFIFRLIGLALFFVTSQKIFLFFFPNVFENFVIFYLVFEFFSKKQKLLISWKLTSLILLSLIIPKLVHEYFMHYIGKQPWEIYNIGASFGFSGFLQEYTNYLTFGTAFYIIPFLILIYLIKHR